MPSKSLYQKEISIHTPAKGVTASHCPLHLPGLISIHTPAKGVTGIAQLIAEGIDISIHTPAKGVTAILSNLGLLFFNSFHQFPN